MGNFCCENKNVDDGNLRSEKNNEYDSIIREDNNRINKIIHCETKINQNSVPNLLETYQTNNNSNYNNYELNDKNDNIPSNPPLLPNKIVPENIILSAKKLKIIILQSKYLEEGKEYIINAGGLIGSKRNAQDGVTYFGDISVSRKINK